MQHRRDAPMSSVIKVSWLTALAGRMQPSVHVRRTTMQATSKDRERSTNALLGRVNGGITAAEGGVGPTLRRA